MFTALLIFHAFIALLLIVIVIIQPGADEGMAMMGGTGTGSAFGADTGAVLTKTTAILGAIFMLNSLLLTVVGTKMVTSNSVVEKVVKTQEQKAPASPAKK